MFDKKQSKSSLSNAFIVSAIAFVLLMGTGYSSMQSFGLDYNGMGDLSAFNGLTQSAECGALGNDCSEDNRVTNNVPGNGNANGNGEEPPIGPIDPSICEPCVAAALDEDQEAALIAELQVANLAGVCAAIEELSVTALLEILTGEGIDLSLDAALELLACLDIDVGVLDL